MGRGCLPISLFFLHVSVQCCDSLVGHSVCLGQDYPAGIVTLDASLSNGVWTFLSMSSMLGDLCPILPFVSGVLQLLKGPPLRGSHFHRCACPWLQRAALGGLALASSSCTLLSVIRVAKREEALKKVEWEEPTLLEPRASKNKKRRGFSQNV